MFPGGVLEVLQAAPLREALTAGPPQVGKWDFDRGVDKTWNMFPGAALSVIDDLPPVGWQSRPPQRIK